MAWSKPSTERQSAFCGIRHSEEGGGELLRLLEDCQTGRQAFDVLCVEGAILRGPHGTGTFQRLAGSGEPMVRLVAGLADRARFVLTVGSYAAFGAMMPAEPGLLEATGLAFTGEEAGGLLGEGWRSEGGLPVINVAGCPPHPGWLVESLMALSTGDFIAGDLDTFGRPRDRPCPDAPHRSADN